MLAEARVARWFSNVNVGLNESVEHKESGLQIE